MFADSDSAVCERKPTRPSIISPPAGPITNEVAPSGHRKIPPQPSVSTVGDVVQRNILQEIGLELSSDDDLPINDNVQIPLPPSTDCLPQNVTTENFIDVATKIPPSKPKTTIMIPFQSGPGRCVYRFVKGGKKGTICDKKSVRGKQLCANHLGLTKKKSDTCANKPCVTKVSVSPLSVSEIPSTPSETEVVLQETLKETQEKLKNLERVVLNLLKNPKQPAVSPTQKPSNTNVNKFKHRSKVIQKIRIYKLNADETYKLIRYQDGLPIVQSKNRLYQVVMPCYMRRPIPNGKWSLVCNSEYPEMIWKEV